jgi:hypothetical protein
MSSRTAMAALALAACAGGGADTNIEDTGRQLPPESTLCKVWFGYDIGDAANFGDNTLGTNADDVRAVLGEPEKHTDTEFTYDWCVGDGCVKHVSATLTFAKYDRCYRETGKPIAPPYWLADAKVEGFSLPSCWHAGSEMPGLCTECTAPTDVVECK